MNCLSVFDHFVELKLKELTHIRPISRQTFTCSKSKIETLEKCEICLLLIKGLQRRQYCQQRLHISHFFLVFILLILSR